MAITKAQVLRPAVPREAVDVPELGGEIIVRGMLLKDRLELFDAASRGGTMMHIGHMLAACVVDANDEQLLNASEWEQFGGQHFERALELFKVVRRLSGLDVETVEGN